MSLDTTAILLIGLIVTGLMAHQMPVPWNYLCFTSGAIIMHVFLMLFG